MATTTDDFSFPTTTNPPPLFIGSPPLWHRTSSTPSPHKENGIRKFRNEDDDDGEQRCNNSKGKLVNLKERKSFSYVERGLKAAREGGCGHGEDKMDSLWEDFNEELTRIQGSDCKYCEASPGRRAVDHFGCVFQGKLSKNGGGCGTVFAGKRPGVVVFMKVLKRVFLLHSSHRPTVKKKTRGITSWIERVNYIYRANRVLLVLYCLGTVITPRSVEIRMKEKGEIHQLM